MLPEQWLWKWWNCVYATEGRYEESCIQWQQEGVHRREASYETLRYCEPVLLVLLDSMDLFPAFQVSV